MSETKESERLARAWIEGWIEGRPDDIPRITSFYDASVLRNQDGSLE